MSTFVIRRIGTLLWQGCGTFVAGIKKVDVVRLSYGAFLVGGLIGVIVAVASFILANLGLAFAGIVLALSNLLAAYQAKRFSYLKGFDEQNEIMKKELSELKLELEKFTQESEKFKEAERSTSLIIPEIQNLQKEGEKVLSEDKQTIDKLEKNLKEAEFKLQKFYELTQKMQEFGSKIGLRVIENQKSNETLTLEIEKIQKCVKSLKEQEFSMDSKIHLLEEETGQMEKIVNIYKQHDELLDQTIKLMEKMGEEQARLIKKFEEDVERLKKETPKIEQVSTNLEDTTNKYELLLKEISEKVEEMKKIQEGSDYKQYMEWKEKK